jgi:hypothetical protein
VLTYSCLVCYVLTSVLASKVSFCLTNCYLLSICISHTLLQLLDTFSAEFLKQPNIVGPAVVFPYPHRINNEPLLTPRGALSEVYVEDIPEGMDPKVYLLELAQGLYEAPGGEGEGGRSMSRDSAGGRGSVGHHYVSNSRLHA